MCAAVKINRAHCYNIVIIIIIRLLLFVVLLVLTIIMIISIIVARLPTYTLMRRARVVVSPESPQNKLDHVNKNVFTDPVLKRDDYIIMIAITFRWLSRTWWQYIRSLMHQVKSLRFARRVKPRTALDCRLVKNRATLCPRMCVTRLHDAERRTCYYVFDFSPRFPVYTYTLVLATKFKPFCLMFRVFVNVYGQLDSIYFEFLLRENVFIFIT